MQKLWTKNFTVITVGSAISMLGNMVAGFAIGLLVLEKTDSTFLYSIFMVFYNMPKVIAPIMAGPVVDRFSRRKIIYTLDFISASIYLFMFLVLNADFFNFFALLAVCIVIGSIDGIYTVAYESFYPNLITAGNFRKAYSISSMLMPLASFMTPVASTVYNVIGTLAPLFLFNSVTFFVAAVCETQIKYTEEGREGKLSSGVKNYIEDFRAGLVYIKGEKALIVITSYFFVCNMAGGVMNTLLLPFFKNNAQLFSHIPIDVITLYTLITTTGLAGRFTGGLIHYKFKYPADKKLFIAIFVYFACSICDGFKLWLPVPVMFVVFFFVGIISVTSYNIRISATQSYVPDTVRGRFNGTFQMITTMGTLTGQIVAGSLGEFLPERTILIGMMIVNVTAITLTMFRHREDVKPLYNRDI
ncbi:MAG: MFS transporter [Oscillospiraceae bacterium]|nr:MFS transporter [Oscillospiraceae bacterium]